MSKKGRTKVDLPESGADTARSSSRKTSSQDETSFSGPDQLFEDDLVQESTASPLKSKKKEGRIKKAFSKIKSKMTKESNEEGSEHVAPSDQKKSSVKEKYQAISPSPCSPAVVADVKEVHVESHTKPSNISPQLSANRIPSLEVYINPSDDASLSVSEHIW